MGIEENVPISIQFEVELSIMKKLYYCHAWVPD